MYITSFFKNLCSAIGIIYFDGTPHVTVGRVFSVLIFQVHILQEMNMK